MKAKIYILAPLCLLVAGPSFGQAGGGTSALKGHDSNAPVDVSADRIEVQDRSDRAILSGNVVVVQGNMTLKAARLNVAYTRVGGTEIQRLDASGGVTVVSPTETAKSNFAVYDLNRRQITMLGNVTLNRTGSNVSGGRMVIDLNTGQAIVDGNAVGGGSAGSGGRVTGRFTVPNRSN